MKAPNRGLLAGVIVRFSDDSRKILGRFSEDTRKILGGFSEDSRKTTHPAHSSGGTHCVTTVDMRPRGKNRLLARNKLLGISMGSYFSTINST